MHEAVVVAARRTPIATRGRALASVSVEQLAAAAARAALDDARAAGTVREPIADLVLGNCMGPGGNPARLAALAAGLGVEVPGATVDRQCGSGLAAIIDAATAIRAGDARPRIAGGAESASTAPVRSRDGEAYERAPFAPEGFPDPEMTRAAEDLAAHDGIPRGRQDAHARRSHERARDARDAGRHRAEIVELAGAREDDAIGAGERTIGRMPALFPGGTLTAATSTRISDGAAAVVLVPRTPGVEGLAVRAHAVVGCDPALPGIGAALAIGALLAREGLWPGDLAALEIVEAFAAQHLAVLDRLGIEEDDPRVGADGGALAFGHPWGASGAIAVVRLHSRLIRAGAPTGALGVAAASVGGGLGIACLLEVVR
ncbi:acetyl-CoA C-acyltransferase [Homoserinibacter sp. YIM 151385]|uniref:acetyl-CoA C-acyltransferase n=1 Tax=Homoserinibacter sp. YIM 151385 TaxID=2985506 RepID=UPI0022F1179B|nr:acetyl-CoA C-acyltransferase [Homoserinibacter sp. YIM 151385]WBU38784.1 acetyl-CoA C-acyltransferase [Homoserinibacter sp. YIM 151385]